MNKAKHHFPILSHSMSRRDEKRLGKISYLSEGHNNIRLTNSLEREYLIKWFLPQLNIFSIKQLINRMTGTKKPVKIMSMYIISYEGCIDIKSFRLTTNEYCVIVTFDLNSPDISNIESVRYLDHKKANSKINSDEN